MLRILSIIFLSFVSLSAFAQVTPKATDTKDLRTENEMFSILFMDDKEKNTIVFSSDSLGSYHLNHSVNSKLVKRKKVPTQTAQKIDENFVDKFITMKYMMDTKVIDDCKSKTTLSMRGEKFSICPKDTERTNVVSELLKSLKQVLI
ncbi:MAG: hypothetical protein CME62_09940 [Halobacteriovoraceae bacterium]|nr:hypothetical protein [Halobacteriovoraceae bacterium]|tara:strand:- start:9198 stop:9638 length:441 start_codon:yes stop_codon:yes gene_type:complete